MVIFDQKWRGDLGSVWWAARVQWCSDSSLDCSDFGSYSDLDLHLDQRTLIVSVLVVIAYLIWGEMARALRRRNSQSTTQAGNEDTT